MKLLCYTMIVAVCGAAFSATASPQRGRPLQEGYLVAGVEGRVVRDAEAEQWMFVPTAPITDGKGKLPADEGVVLLCCSTLEQMAGLAGGDEAVEVRLWAVATEYRGENFLYSLYFLPMKAAQETPPVAEEPAPKAPAAKERDSVLPTEILRMIDARRAPDLKRLDELAVVSDDRNLIGRTGRIEVVDEELFFMADAFGQNLGRRQYRLLPGKALETAQRRIGRSAERQRYVVSGVVTTCNGDEFLLLRRAVRTYTHGNFTP